MSEVILSHSNLFVKHYLHPLTEFLKYGKIVYCNTCIYFYCIFDFKLLLLTKTVPIRNG